MNEFFLLGWGGMGVGGRGFFFHRYFFLKKGKGKDGPDTASIYFRYTSMLQFFILMRGDFISLHFKILRYYYCIRNNKHGGAVLSIPLRLG